MKKTKLAIVALGVLTFASTTPVFGNTSTTGKVEFEAGELTLDPDGNIANKIPKSLNFGSHKLQTIAAESWVATSDGAQDSAVTTGKIMIDDDRGSTGTWGLKVKQDDDFAVDATNKLSNATLVMTTGTLVNNLTTLAPRANPDVTFSLTDQVIFANEARPGRTTLDVTKFTLGILAGTKKIAGTYSTTLTWTLTNESTP